MDESKREADRTFVAEFEASYSAAVKRFYRNLPADVAGSVLQSACSFFLCFVFLKLVHARVDSYIPILIGLFSGTLRFNRSQAARKQANAKLESASDPRLAGALLRLAGSRSPSVRRSARLGLRAVLPLVRSRHAHLIDSEGMNNLLGLLNKPMAAELTIRVIRALEHVGNERAIEPLQRLADPGLWQNDTLLRLEDIQAIAEAAAASLPCIQQRAELARQSAVLLRSSSHGDDSLVRPAAASTQSEEQLLRASRDDMDGSE